MRKDDNGEFWSLAISMAIGAVVNIAATTVPASVTGQKCDGLDILAAGLSGAGMAIPGAAPWVGLGNAIYAGTRSKMKGASWGGSIFVGVTAGLCSASSFTTVAKIPNMSKVITGVVDFVFCTGFNTMTAAVYAGVTSKNSTTTAKSVMKSSPKYKYNTKAKKRSKCSAMRTGCSTDYFRYLYNGGEAF